MTSNGWLIKRVIAPLLAPAVLCKSPVFDRSALLLFDVINGVLEYNQLSVKRGLSN